MTFQTQMTTIVNNAASMPADIAAEVGKIIEVEVMMINGNAFEKFQFEYWVAHNSLPARIAKSGFSPTHTIRWEITAHISTMGYNQPTWVLGRKHLGTTRIQEA